VFDKFKKLIEDNYRYLEKNRLKQPQNSGKMHGGKIA
jgi:hypothetical protein